MIAVVNAGGVADKMYDFLSDIRGDGDNSFIPDVAFHPSGSMFAVSYRKNQIRLFDSVTKTRVVLNKFKNAKALLREKNGVQKLMRKSFFKFLNLFSSHKEKSAKITNGLVIFNVDKNGVLSKEPNQVLLDSGYCRLENISVVGKLCAVADPLDGTVKLYNFDGNHFPDTPTQVIQDRLSFPHDACLSPDKKLLVITNYGIQVIDDEIQWNSFFQPRRDHIAIYELQGSANLA